MIIRLLADLTTLLSDWLAERVLVLVSRMTLLAEQSAAYVAAASEIAAHGCDIDRELVQTTIAGATA